MQAQRLAWIVFAMTGIADLSRAASVQGQVTVAGGQLPIEGASVTLDLDPADGTVDMEARTDGLGRYRIDAVPAGTYTAEANHPRFLSSSASLVVDEDSEHQNFQLGVDTSAPSDLFKLTLDVHCVISQSLLPGTDITVERWESAPAGGPPDDRYNISTDSWGSATLRDLKPGFFRFRASRVGWEDFAWPSATGAQFIDSDHAGIIGLKPTYTGLTVNIEGIRPDRPDQGNVTSGGISGAFVEVTGLDLATRREVLAARTEITPENGIVYFGKLPAIPLMLRVVKMGYEPYIAYIDPRLDGTFAEQDLYLDLHIETSIAVDMSWVYGVFSASGLDAMIEGLPGTAAEGVLRTPSWSDQPGRLFFDEILPGTYRLRISPGSGVGVYASSAGFFDTNPDNALNPGSQLMQVQYEPVDMIIEVVDQATAQRAIEIQVVPVELRGRIVAAEGGAAMGWPSFSGQMDLQAMAGAELEIVPYGDLASLPVGVQTLTVTTDADGRFFARLIPGTYGFRMPGAAEYTAWGMLRPPQATRLSKWPTATPFPFVPDRYSRLTAPMTMGSASPVELELRVVRQVYRRGFSVSYELPLSGSAFLNPDLGLGVIASDLLKSQTAFDVVSADALTIERNTADYADDFWVFGLRPGHHEIRARHPLNVFDNDDVVTFDVYELGAPGMPPPANTYQQIAETTQLSGRLPDPSYADLYIQTQVWDGTEYRDVNGSCIDASYIEYDALPGVFVRGTLLPGGGGATYYFGQQDVQNSTWSWISGHVFGQATPPVVHLSCGGPSDSFAGPGAAPPFASELSVDVQVLDGANKPVTNVQVEVLPGVFAAHGQTVSVTGDPLASPTTDTLGWAVSRATLVPDSASPPRAHYDVVVAKTLEIAGTVRDPSGQPVFRASVQAYNRRGDLLESEQTWTDGTFRITLWSGAEGGVWLAVKQQGYYPIRKKFTAALDANAIAGADLDLVALDGPVVADIQLDRRGVFLPGVIKSGSPTDFDADNAAGNLTTTASIALTSRSIQYNVDAFDREGGGLRSISVDDGVASVYLLYPRWFAAPPDRALASQTFVHQLDSLDLASWQALLGEARSGQDDNGEPKRVLAWQVEAPVSGTTWHVKVPLWTLPAGEFSPLVVAVSEYGGVTTLSAAPDPQKPLRGAAVPQWAATILNVIGTIDALNLGDAVNSLIPSGPIEASGSFTSAIGIRPDKTLTYSYQLGVTFKEGQQGPQSGLMSLAGGLVGLAATGSIKFDVDGGAGTVAVSGGGSLTAEAGDKLGLLKPGMMRGLPITPIQPSLTVSSSIDNIAVVGDTGLTFPEYRLQRSISGFIESGVKVDLIPFASGIPVIGQFLLAARALGAELNAVFKLGIGGTIRRSSLLARRQRGGSSTDSRPIITSLLGDEDSADPDPPESFEFKSSASLEYVSAGEVITLSGGIQLGPQNDTSSKGLRVTFSTDDRFPFVRRVEGAVSYIAHVAVKLAGVGASKDFQIDGLLIDWQSGTTPYMALVPIQQRLTIVTPSTAPAAMWQGRSGTLVDNDYPAGSSTLGEEGGLAYTGTDPNRGVGTVLFAAPDDSAAGGFAEPVEVASAPGIVDLALTQRSDGSWLMAWSQVDAANLGSPFAVTTLHFSESTDGVDWSAPRLLAEPGAYAFALDAASSGAQVGVLWLTTAQLGASEAEVHLGIVESSAVSGLYPIQAQAAIRAAVLAGASGSAAPEMTALVQRASGVVQALRWNGSAVEVGVDVATETDDAVALTYDADDAVIAVVERGGELALVSRAQGGDWENYGASLSDAQAREAAIVSVSDGSQIHNIVAWLQSGESGLLRYAIIDDSAVWVDGPTDADALSEGSLSELDLAPRRASLPSARATVRARTSSGDKLNQYLITLGQGVGSPDAGARDGGVAQDAGQNNDGGEVGTDGGARDGAPADLQGIDVMGMDLGDPIARDAGQNADGASSQDAAKKADPDPPGCGCRQSATGEAAPVFLALAALALLWRRRQRL